MKMHLRLLVLSLGVAACPTASAEVFDNTFGIGGDVVARRNGATENDGLLRIKNASGDAEDSTLDRIGFLKFDLSGLTEAITVGGVQLELPRGASSGQASNTYDAGDTLFLYGIPDLATDEDFDEGTLAFDNSPYLSGSGSVTDPRPASDTTGNGVNDDLATLLDSITFTEQTDAGDLALFTSPELTSFLQADTNDIASFILTVSQTQDPGKTAVFVADTGTEGTPLAPTFLTNDDVPLPSTDFDMLGDGATLLDFELLRNNYLTGTTPGQGDANLDGVVNHIDFFMWRTDYLAEGGVASAISWSPVPEPATLFLLAAASMLAFPRRLRR